MVYPNILEIKMSELYSITNLEGYATDLRRAAAEYICENFDDNLDDYVGINQIIDLVHHYANGYDDEDRPMISEADNENIYGEVITWIHNVGLAKLAARDMLECAWDDELNEMVFWNKEKNQDESNRKNRRQNMESQE
jgi:hypothetical protein